MADVSPGGTPGPGATPPLPEAPPASSAPAPTSGAGPVFASGPESSPVPGPLLAPMPSEATAAVLDPRVDPATGRARTGWRRWLPISGLILLLLAGAIGMLLFLGVNYGGAALAIGLIAAVIPVPLLVSAFLWLDRYEPEPIRYLAFCFAWGAAVATSVALLVNTGASALFDKLGLPDALVAVLVAPFIEESMKAAGPILLFWRRREEWSGITDGIVYAGLSALGFAMVENVLYLGGHGYAAGAQQYGTANGLQNVFAIFIVRILFTGFAHPLFTSMTGIGLGISSRSGDRRVRWLAPIAGLLLAMMLHGTFNLLPTLAVSLSQPFIMLYGYLGFMVPFFFAVVGFAIALRAWEGRIAERILPFYVRTGWFAPPEVAALGSLGRRYSARQWARRVAGPAGQRAMKGFQFAATQLALLRDGMQRGLHRTPVSMRRAELEEQRLLAAVVDYRSTFAGRDPQSPQAFWTGHLYQIAFPDGVIRPITPPDEPVVPVPIRFTTPAYAPYATAAGYGPHFSAASHYPAPAPGSYPSGPTYPGPTSALTPGAPGHVPHPGPGAPVRSPAPSWQPSPPPPGYPHSASSHPGSGASGYAAPPSAYPGSGASGYAAPPSAYPGSETPAFNPPPPSYLRPPQPGHAGPSSSPFSAPSSDTSDYDRNDHGSNAYGSPSSSQQDASPWATRPAYGTDQTGAQPESARPPSPVTGDEHWKPTAPPTD